jgi:phage terminase large subunit-like protein
MSSSSSSSVSAFSADHRFKCNIAIGEKHLVADEHRYVALPHNTDYGIFLHNLGNTRCQVTVDIDGKGIGSWILGAHRSVTLTRPQKEEFNFCFLQTTSTQAAEAGITIGKSTNGVVHVKFEAEAPTYNAFACFLHEGVVQRAIRSDDALDYTTQLAEPPGYTAGATGLKNPSTQTFGKTHGITNFDSSATAEFTYRLVVGAVHDPRCRPLHPDTPPPPVRDGPPPGYNAISN